MRDDFHILIVTSYFLCSGVKRVKMTYFGHFNFLVNVLKYKAYMSRNKKKHETNVAEGGGGAANFYFFLNSPSTGLHRYNHPTNTRCSVIIGLMLGQRRRLWLNIKPTMNQQLVFDGRAVKYVTG